MIKGKFMKQSTAVIVTPIAAYLTYVMYEEELTLLVMLLGVVTLRCAFEVLDQPKKHTTVIVGGVRRRRVRRIWWRL